MFVQRCTKIVKDSSMIPHLMKSDGMSLSPKICPLPGCIPDKPVCDYWKTIDECPLYLMMLNKRLNRNDSDLMK